MNVCWAELTHTRQSTYTRTHMRILCVVCIFTSHISAEHKHAAIAAAGEVRIPMRTMCEVSMERERHTAPSSRKSQMPNYILEINEKPDKNAKTITDFQYVVSTVDRG